MSILSTPTTPAHVAAGFVLSSVRHSYKQLHQSGTRGYNAIWKNPKATPDEVIEALGTNARAVFEMATLNLQTIAYADIAGIRAPVIPDVPPQYILTFNEDGSANLTSAYSSSSSNE